MSTTHIVKQGEHLAGIASQYGFKDFRIIWNHPGNAALKQQRKNPNILFPGDRVFIPDPELKTEDEAVDKKHIFQASLPELRLRIAVRDIDDKPVSAAPYILALGSGSRSQPTDKDGKLDEPIAASDSQGELTVTSQRMQLRLFIGGLNPLQAAPEDEADPALKKEAIAAWQDRLNNLGYFAGFTHKDDVQLRWAIEEFQRDHGWDPNKGKKPTGKTDQKTRDALEDAYGC